MPIMHRHRCSMALEHNADMSRAVPQRLEHCVVAYINFSEEVLIWINYRNMNASAAHA